MNYWKHSLLSRKKFGGAPEDYLAVHAFLDGSKLFFFDLRHRALLHHTYGISLCIRKFGETLVNSEGRTVLLRDVAAEHCKEDLAGIVPALPNWFRGSEAVLAPLLKPVTPRDTLLRDFLWEPYLLSGLYATLLITHSSFGLWLAREVLGLDAALELAPMLSAPSPNEWLPQMRFTERWQFRPDLQQLKDIDHELPPTPASSLPG